MKQVNSVVVYSCLVLALLLGSLTDSFAVLTAAELSSSQQLYQSGHLDEALARLQPLAGEMVLTAEDADACC